MIWYDKSWDTLNYDLNPTELSYNNVVKNNNNFQCNGEINNTIIH